MAITHANGIDIYYEMLPARQPDPASPDKTPLLLIMGLAFSSVAWKRLLPYLTARRDVIIFDNRGSGRTSMPDQPYSIKQMAADSMAVLDALKIKQAHVFGFSMGCMIAQEVALNYPSRVKGLILGAGTPGGLRHRVSPPRVLLTMGSRMLQGREEAAKAVASILYSRRFREQHPDIVAEDQRTRMAYPQPLYAYRRQLGAIARHNTYSRLSQLNMPTLVVTGDEDVLVMPQNSRTLAGRIPRAELVVLAGGGHNLISEQPQKLAGAVLSFLDKHFGKA